MITFIINTLKLAVYPLYQANSDLIKCIIIIMTITLLFGVFRYLIRTI